MKKIEQSSIMAFAKALSGDNSMSANTTGTVVRSDEEGIWVVLEGSEDATPMASSTVAVAEGDKVMVRIDGGNAVVTGNVTSPSTDDSKAVEAASMAGTAHAAAMNAQASADAAGIAAEDAMSKADIARAAAESAVADAETARQAAVRAQGDADAAKTSAAAADAAAKKAVEDTVVIGQNLSAAQAALDELGGKVEDKENYFYHDGNGAHVVGQVGSEWSANITADQFNVKNLTRTIPTMVVGSNGLEVNGVQRGSDVLTTNVAKIYASSGNTDIAPYYDFGIRRDDVNIGEWSLCSGDNDTIDGKYSAAFGHGNSSFGDRSFVAGHLNNSTNDDEAMFGKFGTSKADAAKKSLFVVGNGTSESSRSNAFEVYDNGDMHAAGAIKSAGTAVSLDGHTHDGRYYTEAEVDAKLAGKQGTIAFSKSGDRWGVVPEIGADGVMEVGKYIDFHESDGDTGDYSVRIACDGGNLSVGGNQIATANMIPSASDLLVVQNINLTNQTDVAANSYKSWTQSVAKSGYTPVGVVGVYIYNCSNFVPNRFVINGTTLTCSVRNLTTSAKSMSNTSYVKVLYMKA